MSQNGQKVTSLMTSFTKNLKPKTKKNFSLLTRRLAKSWGFEHLSSAIAWRAMWLVRQPKYAWF